MCEINMNERMELTHSNKPVNPKRTMVANRPSTEASKPWPRHTVLPARDSRPSAVAGIGEEVEEECVGVGDDRESSVFVKEFVLVRSDGSENDEEVKEGEVEKDEVEVVSETGVEDIPDWSDDGMSQEHEEEERDAVPDAQRSRIFGAAFNLERPSPRKAISDITVANFASVRLWATQTT
jgi:hypothetical protein